MPEGEFELSGIVLELEDARGQSTRVDDSFNSNVLDPDAGSVINIYREQTP